MKTQNLMFTGSNADFKKFLAGIKCIANQFPAAKVKDIRP